MSYEEFLNEWNDQQRYIEVHTSGSTGEPKNIRLEKDFIIESAIRTNNFFNINAKSHLHSCISPDFIGGKMMAVRSQVSRCKLTWEIPSNAPLGNMPKEAIIDLLAVVPSQMHHILRLKENQPTINAIIIGGAPIPEDLRKQIAKSGLNAYETYGMTETASHIAIRKVCYDNIPFTALDGIKIGKDEKGCLTIFLSEKKRILTNDLCELISDNQFFIRGRRDNMIITGAKKVNPLDLEKILAPIIKSDFMITGFPDDKWGEKIVLLIKLSPSELPRREKMKKYFKEKTESLLKAWERPKEIFFVSAFPETVNGKRKRSKLREDYSFFEP